MTVDELMIKLSIYPKDWMVVTDGYEEGFAEYMQVKRLRIVLNKHIENDCDDESFSIYGHHGRVDKYGGDKGKDQASVVFVGEGRHLEDGI